MTLQGKGFFTSNLSNCEGGEPISIVSAAQAAGLSHVIVKVADGVKSIGLDGSGFDVTTPAIQALRNAGMAVWGWQSIYGNDPSAEAALALARTRALALDGYVIAAGAEFEQPGMSGAARQFMAVLHAGMKVPIALSSYRFPNFHPGFPWSDFLLFCSIHMPQVYWEQAHDAAEQLIESRRQCAALPNARPFIPTGATYRASTWSPTDQDITDFLDTAEALALPALNFFCWDTCHANLAPVWKAIAGFAWPASAPGAAHAPDTLPDPGRPAAEALPAPDTLPAPEAAAATPTKAFLRQFLAALNSRQPAQISTFYDQAATQVWADQIRHGALSIQAGFAAFFATLPAGTGFIITSTKVEDDMYTLAWKAGSLTGETILTLKNGKIILDYTFIA
ncbi:MAG TPA: nuclear transport factor 2 family protein [Anaerolineales bacterium]|nr:nuclear transport factor 2 family protein [Anaerolineales bacterium]